MIDVHPKPLCESFPAMCHANCEIPEIDGIHLKLSAGLIECLRQMRGGKPLPAADFYEFRPIGMRGHNPVIESCIVESLITFGKFLLNCYGIHTSKWLPIIVSMNLIDAPFFSRRRNQ